MTQEIEKATKDRMDKAIDALKRDLGTLRAGRSSPTFLDRVVVSCYGGEVPLKQVASISTPDATSLLIQPFDNTIRKEIERSIMKADLGVTPRDDGQSLRIVMPSLSEERRKEFVKMAQQMGEKTKITIRSVRRDANKGADDFSEDVKKRFQTVIQKITNDFNKEVDNLISSKEKEILRS